ncbi:DNA-binding transcriptional regulator, HxlR family [Nonomuraea maritima]|uniref:DNA-binding transcriptional regulator, HxlR family n=1 Tax=Nonomuraea maritima TaxID=683260 RepID=A0A1G9S6I8_9ACTN|nr:helix-turn-helix domain-containing protein [Nonomuraea maritima]SDM30375.1 DNA-binding transcriptional regulator, HxlR family [Nonomuraea maritima]
MEGVRSAVRQVPGPCSHWNDDEADFIRHVLDRIGDKWSVLIVGTLEAGALRYSELAYAIPGISQRMLTLTLRQLTQDGIVSRTAYPEVPPRVEYELTPLGRSLLGVVLDLAAWAVDNHKEIHHNRTVFAQGSASAAGTD